MTVRVYPSIPTRRLRRRLSDAIAEFRRLEFAGEPIARAHVDAVVDAAEMIVFETRPKPKPIDWEREGL